MGKMSELSYCAQAVRDHSRDRFLQSLFVPQPAREAVLAILSLDVELAHVHRSVSEEMLGHIRYAWWEESLAMIGEGKKSREHPVLLALVPIVQQGIVPAALLVQLTEQYRAHYPQMPPENPLLNDMILMVIRTSAPQAEQGWHKADAVIKKHRSRYGKYNNGWLSFKLLWTGVMP